MNAPSTSATRVLVVEDDPSVLALLHALLTAEGYRVESASDGVAGLDSARAETPAAILLDLVMPDLDGAGLIEQLRASLDLADIPVLVLTGREDAASELRATVGADNVLGKPFETAELLERLVALTGGPNGDQLP